MSDLTLNKVFGAVLATGLVILGLRTVSEMVFEVEPPEKPGYAIAVQEEAETTTAVADTPPDWGTVLASADTAAGQTVSTKCASCHSFAAGGPAMTGPDLYSVIGRKPGGSAGFAYSPAMVEYGGAHPAWTYDELYMFLAAPQKHINGTKMTFVGLKKPEERIALIAWLRTQAASPAPIPAPNPAAAAAAAEANEGSTTGVVAETTPAEGAAGEGEPTAAAAGAPASAKPGAPTTGAAAAPTAITTTDTPKKQ
ncbi:MAG: hypothetical protein B7Y99_05175 [Caulobacterales bacterium 32-69-10]|nr:MAG: hypothetical protein B7Y99_05175 [Caulobacterales bacterium 32-69-10]